MGRKKQIITKSTYLRFRIEPEIKNMYLSFCKENKIKPSTQLRDFMLKEIGK